VALVGCLAIGYSFSAQKQAEIPKECQCSSLGGARKSQKELPVLCLIDWRFTNENFLCNLFCADKAVTKIEDGLMVGMFFMACRRHPGGSPVHLDHPEEAWPPCVSPLLAHESAAM
jgi:hypothetical protein